MARTPLLLTLLAFVALSSNPAFGEAAALVEPKAGRLSEVLFTATRLNVEIRNDEGLPTAVVMLQGSFAATDATLLHDFEPVAMRPGPFSLSVALKGPRTSLSLQVVTASGEVSTATYLVETPEWRQIRARLSQKRSTRPRIFLSAAATRTVYRETLVPDYWAFTLTPKISLTKLFEGSRFDMNVTAFMTATTFSSSAPEANVRFLGVNGRLGYVLPQIQEPWKVSLMVGVYFSKMFVTGNRFGYTPVLYPQLYPTVRRSFGGRDDLGGYLKYVPISTRLNEREIAVGLSWNHYWSGLGRWISLSTDFSDLRFQFSPTVDMRLTTFSVGVGMGF